MKFRKKPVVIEAFQWKLKMGEVGPVKRRWLLRYFIETLEGAMQVNDSDWVIQGIKGEFYPCKPEIFEATYERVDA